MGIQNKEIRTFKCELRKEGEKRTVTGTAALFNSRTELWTDTFEEIAEGAFDDVMNDDVRALFNHNEDNILARTKSGTLRLSVDSGGLKYEFDAPNTTAGNDLLESLSRGDIDQSSFAFSVKSVEWTDLGNNKWLRKILKIKRLYDVSPVTYPAYEDTTVALREKEKRDQDINNELEEEKNKQAEIQRKHNERLRHLELLKRK
jgi:uncharacterized protein